MRLKGGAVALDPLAVSLRSLPHHNRFLYEIRSRIFVLNDSKEDFSFLSIPRMNGERDRSAMEVTGSEVSQSEAYEYPPSIGLRRRHGEQSVDAE